MLFAEMARPKDSKRNMPSHKQARGVVIDEGTAASKEKEAKSLPREKKSTARASQPWLRLQSTSQILRASMRLTSPHQTARGNHRILRLPSLSLRMTKYYRL